jgi:hypothetical protein
VETLRPFACLIRNAGKNRIVCTETRKVAAARESAFRNGVRSSPSFSNRKEA